MKNEKRVVRNQKTEIRGRKSKLRMERGLNPAAPGFNRWPAAGFRVIRVFRGSPSRPRVSVC